MANLTIPDLPDITTASSSDVIAAYQSSTGKLTLAKVLSLVIGGASSGFDTLKKLEDGKLSIDGSIAMSGDIDADGNRIINQAFPGQLLGNPTVITVSDASFTYSADCRFAIWILQGAGAGGCGASSTSASNASAGPGGRSGSWLLGLVDVESLVTKGGSVTIGAAGSGGTGDGAGNGNAGTTGGSTIYIDETNTFTALGGSNSTCSSSSDLRTYCNSGALAAATGGLINGIARDGFSGMISGTAINSNLFAQPGCGGDSLFGSGGRLVRLVGSGAATLAGGAATGYGSGGSGAASIANGGNATGGDGAPGIALLLEFY